MEGLSIALSAFSFALKIGRHSLVEKRLKDGDTTNKTLCKIILTEINEVRILLERQKQLNLLESLHLFEEGIRYLDGVLSNESLDEKEMKEQAAELKKDFPWKCLIEADLLIKNIERLKNLPDQGEAAIKVSKATERFKHACEKARSAFWTDSLSQSSDAVLAANIGVTSVILENYRDPWVAMEEYETWLESDQIGSEERTDASAEELEESKVQKKAEHSKSTKDTKNSKDRDTKEQFKKSQGPKGLTEVKDIAITDNGSVLVLNSDGSVDVLKDEVQTEHRKAFH